jgi:hypothetical protein
MDVQVEGVMKLWALSLYATTECKKCVCQAKVVITNLTGEGYKGARGS